MFRNLPAVFSNVTQCSSINFLPQRTTFILSRMHPPKLNKKAPEAPKKLRRRNFYYRLVEDKLVKKQPLIDLLLIKNIEGVGNAGDTLAVPQVRAYECFILPRAGVLATPENLKKYQNLKTHSSIPVETQLLLKQLKETHVAVFMNDFNPWTIEPWHIKLSLNKLGIMCNESDITLPKNKISGPSVEVEKKDFVIHLNVLQKYLIPMRCRIYHIKLTGANFFMTFNPKFYLDPISPLFPEDEELLKSIPLPSEKKTNKIIIS